MSPPESPNEVEYFSHGIEIIEFNDTDHPWEIVPPELAREYYRKAYERYYGRTPPEKTDQPPEN